MPIYEYSVIPAPNRGAKSKDAKAAGDHFAATLTQELNRMARDGWEYLRADVLPCEERSGLTGRATVYHNLLVFRRAVPQPATASQPTAVIAPEAKDESAPATNQDQAAAR